jgi:hypothetical protein
MAKKLEEMSLEELEAQRDALAAERHDLRLRQKDVEEAIAFRKVQLQLPVELRNRIVLQGGIGPQGGKD